ncbi:MAG: hypothetical protein ACXAEU_22450 [Candidatus Hodarchaeales archaeon]|jgi:hypothetical protein
MHKDTENSTSLIISGSKILVAENIGWIVSFIIILLYIPLQLTDFPIFVFIATIINLIVIIALFTGDLVGFSLLGLGMLRYDENPKYSSKAGITIFIWVAMAIIWRILVPFFVYFLLPSLDNEQQLFLTEILEWIFFTNSIILFIALIFLVRVFENPVMLVYGMMNIIASFLFAPLFLSFNNEFYLFMGTLYFIGPVFKAFVIPLFGIATFQQMIKDARPISVRKKIAV